MNSYHKIVISISSDIGFYLAKGFDLTYKVVKNEDYDLKLTDIFFTGDDQNLIFDVNKNLNVLTDFYNS